MDNEKAIQTLNGLIELLKHKTESGYKSYDNSMKDIAIVAHDIIFTYGIWAECKEQIEYLDKFQ